VRLWAVSAFDVDGASLAAEAETALGYRLEDVMEAMFGTR
jgi:hypothetical protein